MTQCNILWYLGATTKKNRWIGLVMTNKARFGWAKWTQTSGLLCDH